MLRMPYIGVFSSYNDLRNSTAKPPIMELDLTAELVEGADGILSFEVKSVGQLD